MLGFCNCRITAEMPFADLITSKALEHVPTPILETVVSAGSGFGYHLGIAFQIVDDLLDVCGDPGLLGKNVGMDGNKMTWVALKGIEAAKADAEAHTREAVRCLEGLPWDTSFFRKLAMDNLTRTH